MAWQMIEEVADACLMKYKHGLQLPAGKDGKEEGVKKDAAKLVSA